MEVYGWGRYPRIRAKQWTPSFANDIHIPAGGAIAYGLGRGYGDSALAPSIIGTRNLDRFLSFDANRGIIECESGVTFEQILNFIIPRGWFLPVTPGTQFITVGGAVASDVHGKNHHREGTFGDYITQLTLHMGPNGAQICSPEKNTALFRATIGGMGLTGIITGVKFKLKKINSVNINKQTHKARDWGSALDLFAEFQSATYSMAWIDCVSGAGGRSIIMTGEHADDGDLNIKKSKSIGVPFTAPGCLLNPFSIRLFNSLYYHKSPRAFSKSKVYFAPFFYPLDSVRDWNRLYGKNGFVQYQFVLPTGGGRRPFGEIFKRIQNSGMGSFLAVLKTFGKANNNLLSFPMPGWTLALDFKIQKGLFPLLDTLDDLVVANGGRVYLTKDARMKPQIFRESYPQVAKLEKIRRELKISDLFRSVQSTRLGIQ